MHAITLFRSALAAFCVVGLAACAAVTGTGDPSVAATVNGTDVPIAEVEERFAQAKDTPQVAQQLEQDPGYESQIQAQILTSLVVTELLDQWAEELEIEASPTEIASEKTALVEQLGGEEAFNQAVEESGLSDTDVDDQIRQRVLQNEIAGIVAEDGAVTEADIEAFYKENADARFGEKATARHILVKDKAKADQLLADIRKGADFAKIAEKESTDPGSAAKGGELPEFGRGQMVPEFEEAVFAAETDEIVGPVKTDFGYHIIQVIDRTPGQELDEVRDEIEAELAQTKEGELLQDALTERTEAAEVTVNPRFGTWNAETGQIEPTKPLGETSESGVPGGPASTELPLVPTESATQ